jgi:hypothetical protein
MTPWVNRVIYPSIVVDIVLNLLIAASAIAMLMLGIFLFA